MKRIFFALLASGVMFNSVIMAQEVNVVAQTSFAPVTWVSKDASNEVTIQNQSGQTFTITINVNASAIPKKGGVDVRNCGSVGHINAGSSAICTSSDSQNPVTLKSDSATDSASGTYQMKQ
jgi:hypothetical protein